MQYDIEADFCLLTTCNFRCSYCFIPPAALGAKLTVRASNAEWARAFDDTGKRWLIHLTGGEPFIYPQIADLCERLSRRHFLSINSNLAHPSVKEFARVVSPARVHFINAALHYDERERKGQMATFIERAKLLKRTGFAVMVSLVMTPSVIERFAEISKRMEAEGLPLVPKTLREKFEGREYPAAYSPAERAMLRQFLAQAREQYAEVIAQMGERPTIDMLDDDRHLEGFPDYRGRVCCSGYNFVEITPNGNLLRCGSGERLGNLLLGNLRLLSGPKPCDTTYCPYWCEKYTSRRFVGNAWVHGVQLTVLGGEVVRM